MLYSYTPDGKLATLTAVNGVTGNQVTQYVYGTTLADSSIARSDLLRAAIYPDSDNTAEPLGNGPSGVYDRVEYTYNRQGQIVTKKDQNCHGPPIRLRRPGPPDPGLRYGHSVPVSTGPFFASPRPTRFAACRKTLPATTMRRSARAML